MHQREKGLRGGDPVRREIELAGAVAQYGLLDLHEQGQVVSRPGASGTAAEQRQHRRERHSPHRRRRVACQQPVAEPHPQRRPQHGLVGSQVRGRQQTLVVGDLRGDGAGEIPGVERLTPSAAMAASDSDRSGMTTVAPWASSSPASSCSTLRLAGSVP